jgi:hypothetical protein
VTSYLSPHTGLGSGQLLKLNYSWICKCDDAYVLQYCYRQWLYKMHSVRKKAVEMSRTYSLGLGFLVQLKILAPYRNAAFRGMDVSCKGGLKLTLRWSEASQVFEMKFAHTVRDCRLFARRIDDRCKMIFVLGNMVRRTEDWRFELNSCCCVRIIILMDLWENLSLTCFIGSVTGFSFVSDTYFIGMFA